MIKIESLKVYLNNTARCADNPGKSQVLMYDYLSKNYNGKVIRPTITSFRHLT